MRRWTRRALRRIVNHQDSLLIPSEKDVLIFSSKSIPGNEKNIVDNEGRFSESLSSLSWTLTGLTAGTAYQYWVGFKSVSTIGTPHLQWGGNSSGEYPDFIMKATALPATITT